MKYKVTKNGKFKFAGTHNECFAFILNNQGQSVHHAVTYEGWNITDTNNSNSVTKNIAIVKDGTAHYMGEDKVVSFKEFTPTNIMKK